MLRTPNNTQHTFTAASLRAVFGVLLLAILIFVSVALQLAPRTTFAQATDPQGPPPVIGDPTGGGGPSAPPVIPGDPTGGGGGPLPLPTEPGAGPGGGPGAPGSGGAGGTVTLPPGATEGLPGVPPGAGQAEVDPPAGPGEVPKVTPDTGRGNKSALNSNTTPTGEAEAPNQLSCKIFSGITDFSPDFTCILANVANGIFWLGSVIVGLAGTVLNFVIVETIMRMGYNINNIAGITEAWVVLRDLANIVFVFALIIIGVETILGTNRFGAKRLLVSLILAALLVNFSLFFTKAIIDVTNLLSKEIYGQINAVVGADASCELNTLYSRSQCVDGGLSGQLMNQLRLTSLHDTSVMTTVGENTAALSWSGILTISAIGFIFLIITAFIFLAGAFMLMVRFIILIFLMIFSPLAFAATVLPQTQSYASKWWSTLFSQAFFAPAFFLMIYISFRIFTTMRSTTAFALQENDGFAHALVGAEGSRSIVILFNFFIVIGFLVLSLVVASRLGAYGASGAMKMGQNISRWAGGKVVRGAGAATFGLGALTAQTIIGSDAARLANNEKLRTASRRGGLTGFLAKGIKSGAEYASRATYDVRNVGGFGKKTGLGESKKGGFTGRIERIQKREKEFGESFAKSAGPNESERGNLEYAHQQLLEKRTRLSQLNTQLAAEKSLGGLANPETIRRIDTERVALIGNPGDRKSITGLETQIKRINDAVSERGTVQKNEYAKTLANPGFFGRFTLAGTEGKAQAATELRKGQSDLDKIKKALKDAGITTDTPAPAPAPTTPAPSGGGGTPAGGGAGGAGGGGSSTP